MRMDFYKLIIKKFQKGFVNKEGWFCSIVPILEELIRVVKRILLDLYFLLKYILDFIFRHIMRLIKFLLEKYAPYLPALLEAIDRISRLCSNIIAVCFLILQDLLIILELILEFFINLINNFISLSKAHLPALRIKRYKQYLIDSNPLNTIHPFHMVAPSPWPIMTALGAFLVTSGMIAYMHNYKFVKHLLPLGLFMLIYVMYSWSQDIIREGLYEGKHNSRVQTGLAMGFVLFVVSEVMFFFSFFWAFFYFSSSPVFNPEIAWPPKAVIRASVYGLPLFNTVLLLISGISVTWAHHSTLLSDKKNAVLGLSYTIFFAILFMCVQLYEYKVSTFSMSDGVYGSCFYILTGCHGVHVFVGTIGIIVSLIRTFYNHFTAEQHLGLESAIWYWHFVDVVWLLVFTTIYWWG
jgi:heme/copper-type cytochrome/quinol oxidase subunit 3